MWKSLAVVAIGVVALAGWLSRAPGQEAVAVPGEVQLPDGQVHDPEVQRRVARDFAVWIEDIILQKTDAANRLFPLQPYAQKQVMSNKTVEIFSRFPKLEGMDITLVGWRALGEQAGVLLFTTVTEHGPVAFKIYHYKYGNNRSIGKIEVTDEWSEIERMYTTIDPLPVPVTVPL